MRAPLKALVLAAVICLSTDGSQIRAQSVTFVQFTDAHLFDSAKHRSVQAGYEDYLDNRSSLEWAVRTINDTSLRLRCLDFVAFTGDFGLEDTDPLQAARDVAIFFKAIETKKILLVPGNNDLKNEDSRDLGRYRAFVDELARLLPNHQITDLTRISETINGIRIVGMNSATFKNDGGRLRNTNGSDQLKEMQRVEAEIRRGGPSIIFTHIPDLEDPHRDDDHTPHPSWYVSMEMSLLWQSIINDDQLLGVFAGHFHDPRRQVYTQDYSWAVNKPSPSEAKKTWLAPPLAVKFQSGETQQARGLLLVTVASSGAVSVSPKWYSFAAATDQAPDKSAALFEGEAEARYGNWKDALTHYTQALPSTDPDVRSKAERGYLHARKRLYVYRVFKWVLWVVLASILLGFGWRLWIKLRRIADENKRQNKVIIETPLSLTKDAPVEFFAAALLSAANDIRSVYRAEQQRSSMLLADGGWDRPFLLLSGAASALSELANAMPEVRGVKVGNVLKALPFWLKFLLKWCVESGLGMPDSIHAYAYASLRWRSTTTKTWLASAVFSPEADLQEAVQFSLVKSLAWEVASDILSKDLIDSAQ